MPTKSKRVKVVSMTAWAVLSDGDFARQEYDEGLPHLFLDKQDALDFMVKGDRLVMVEIRPLTKRRKGKG